MVDRKDADKSGYRSESSLSSPNLQLILEKSLNGAKQLLTPNMFIGFPASLRMSDSVAEGFFDTVARADPDGYIVGVGMGGLLTFLQCFSRERPPRGIVSIDANPSVVLTTKLFIEVLKQSETKEELIERFFKMPDEEYKSRTIKLVKRDKDRNLKDNFRKEVEHYRRTGTFDPFWPTPSAIWRFAQDKDPYPLPKGGVPSVVEIGLNNFRLLKDLAEAGNIASIYADFLDPLVVQAVTELPNFRESSNIIYLSNLVEFKVGYGKNPEGLKFIAGLKAYENTTRPTIFVDSLSSQDLYLRMGHTVPEYKIEDIH